jgi:acetolactate synthase I/II/III large subunit
MRGTEAIAEILKREGVEFIACFPHNDLIEASARVGIRPIVCRQERVGIAIADGFSRITNGNRIGVFVMQHGPGAENAFPGVAQAFTDNVPLLVLPAGEATPRQGVKPVFSAFDNYAHVTKWRAFVNSPDRIAAAMRHAFYRLRTGKCGPVLIETTVDALAGELKRELDYEPVKGSRCAPEPQAVTAALDTLVEAKAPVIYAGQGVLFAQATAELVEIAERLDCPVLTTMPGKSAFPEQHPLSIGASAITKPEHMMHFLNQADCVFGIGTSFTRTLYGTNVPPGKVLIQVTNSEEDINKDYAVRHGLVGDAKLTLQALNTELERRGINRGPGARAEDARARKSAFVARWQSELESDEVPINQYRIVHELMQRLDPHETIITHDAGTPREQLISFWEAPVPRSYLGWGKTTQLGFGLGAMMGAKLAEPDKLCVNIMGDSAIGMVGMDIETAVRNRLGILTIVFNNGIMAIESNALTDAQQRYRANDQGGDYAGVARALGAWSRRVERPEEIAPALDAAIAATQSGQPALLDCIVKAGYIWPGRGDPEPRLD